jgi:hypothetical protein
LFDDEPDVICEYCGTSFVLEEETLKRVRELRRSTRGPRKRSTQRIENAATDVYAEGDTPFLVLFNFVYGCIAIYALSTGRTWLFRTMLLCGVGTAIMWFPQWKIGHARLARFWAQLPPYAMELKDIPRSEWTAERTRQVKEVGEKAEAIAKKMGDEFWGNTWFIMFFIQLSSPLWLWSVMGKVVDSYW